MTFELYRHFDAQGQLLYVGQTRCGPTRQNAHRKDSAWWGQVVRVEIERLSGQAELDRAEVQAIRLERPRHNIRHNRRGPQTWSEMNRGRQLSPRDGQLIMSSRLDYTGGLAPRETLLAPGLRLFRDEVAYCIGARTHEELRHAQEGYTLGGRPAESPWDSFRLPPANPADPGTRMTDWWDSDVVRAVTLGALAWKIKNRMGDDDIALYATLIQWPRLRRPFDVAA